MCTNNKKLNRNRRVKTVSMLLMLAVAATTYMSCNKGFDNTLNDDYGTDGGAGKTQHTLVIVVDGAVGEEVQKIQPPYISVLTDNAIYSWNGLTDIQKHPVTNALGWTTLLTGVNANKHNVYGEGFTGNNLQNFPSVFTRLKTAQPEWRTAAFCASADLATNLAADATQKEVFANNDAGVKDAVLNELATNNPRFVLAQFHDVDRAGAAGSYSEANAGYKAAILQTDAYIKQLVEALSNRPTYSLENWMIIVTSNKGSILASDPAGADKLAYDDSRRNTFFVCFSPNIRLSYKPGSLPFSGNTPVYNGSSSGATKSQAKKAGTLLNIGASGSYTIECKVRIPAGNYYYPAIFSKRASFTGGVVGWTFFLEADYWMVNFGQTGLGNRQIRGAAISDGKWHTLTMTIRQVDATTRRVETFTDGVYYDGGITDATRNIHSYGNLNSPAPLTLGQLGADNVTGLLNYNITDVKMYDTAFGRDYIQSNYCRTSLPEDDPYIKNLMAYWSCRQIVKVGAADGMKGMSGKYANNPAYPDFNADNLDLELSGGFGKAEFVQVVNNICPTPDANSFKVVPNSADLVTQTLAWLGIQNKPSWNLDGATWLSSYMNL